MADLTDALLESYKPGELNDGELDSFCDMANAGLVDPNEIDYDKLFSAAPKGIVESFRDNDGILSESDSRAFVKTIDRISEESKWGRFADRIVAAHMAAHRPRYDAPTPIDMLRSEIRMLQEADTNIAAIDKSYMDMFADRCQRTVYEDMTCPVAELGLQDCFARRNEPCSAEEIVQYCEWPMDPPPDLECVCEDDAPALFYGLGKRRCWSFPKPCTISFAFAMHRNLVCVDPNRFVRSQIDARVRWFDIIDEMNAINMFFGIDGCGPGCTPKYPFMYDGNTYESGWQKPGSGAPWFNVITDPDLQWNSCTMGPMCAIENIFEEMEDPTNGFPIDCAGDYQVMLTKQCKKNDMIEVLGARTVDRCLQDTTCATNASALRPAREGWDTNVKYSRWIWKQLVKYYRECYYDTYVDANGVSHNVGPTNLLADPVLAQRTAEHWAANTYLVSRGFQRSFAQIFEYDISTREYGGENTWAYFDRGIMWAKRFDRKATYGWLRPWLTLLIRAFDPTVASDGTTAIPTP